MTQEAADDVRYGPPPYLWSPFWGCGKRGRVRGRSCYVMLALGFVYSGSANFGRAAPEAYKSFQIYSAQEVKGSEKQES